MTRIKVRATNDDTLDLDICWLPMLYSTLPLNLLIPSKEAMDALIHYAKERDKITRKWATIKTMHRELNIATVEARCTGAGVPAGVTTDALIAALDHDFIREHDPALLEQIGRGACMLRMRSLADACYEKFLSDGMPEPEARRRLGYYYFLSRFVVE